MTTSTRKRPDEPARSVKRNRILIGDVRHRLAELPDNSIDTVITSPPYFRLRNYQQARQIGLEDGVSQWVQELSDVFDGVARVLKPTGAIWLNLGDSYSRHPRAGAPAKSLLLAPERLLLALAQRGWSVRNKVIWAKTNPMPASVKDRLATTHEYVYFLTRARHYHFDLDAIRATPKGNSKPKAQRTRHRRSAVYPPIADTPPSWQGPLAGNNKGLSALRSKGLASHPQGKNPGDVWHLATASYRGAHFATFPQSLVTRPLLATCPEQTCSQCGQPWVQATARTLGHLAVHGNLVAACQCNTDTRPGIVLDPFFGAGTVGLVAQRLGRDWIGIELNPKFATLATERIRQDQRSSGTRTVQNQQANNTRRTTHHAAQQPTPRR